MTAAHVVSLPLKTKFRGLDSREVLLIEGKSGWTEWSPFIEYEDPEAARWLGAAVEFGFGQIPASLRTEIGINATLPAIDNQAEISELLARFGTFRTVKIKVAETEQSADQDLARIQYVSNAHPNAKIRIDANGAWSVEQALGFLQKLVGINIEYIEQPCATLGELAQLRVELSNRDLRFPVAIDESIRKSTNPSQVDFESAADVFVIKNQPLGGIAKSLNLAAKTKIPVVVSSALESSVGISMGLHLAAALPKLELDCGLGTVALFDDDVVEQSLIARNGKLGVQRVNVSAAKLEELAVTYERKNWWLARLERCYQLLTI